MSVSKGIGFNRNILLPWLDTTAALCLETDDEKEIKLRLKSILAEEINSPTNLRKTVAILLNIWHKTAETEPELQKAALDFYQSTDILEDRLWLHYGMVMIAYPFFYQGTRTIGQLTRYGDTIVANQIRKQLIAEIGQLGSLNEAVSRIVFSLREWGLLVPADTKNSYTAQREAFSASNTTLEAWLLACTLRLSPSEEIPFADLIRQSALFPFKVTLSLDDLRQVPWFDIQRQGIGMNMVRLGEIC